MNGLHVFYGCNEHFLQASKREEWLLFLALIATRLVIHNTFFQLKEIRKVQMLSTEFLVNIEHFHSRG